MYKITVENENGEVSVIENVLDYNVIDLSLVQKVADDFEIKLTDEEIKEFEEDLQSWEELPDTYQLQGLIEDIINGRD